MRFRPQTVCLAGSHVRLLQRLYDPPAVRSSPLSVIRRLLACRYRHFSSSRSVSDADSNSSHITSSSSTRSPDLISSSTEPSTPASSRVFMSGTSLQRVLLLRHAESLGNTGEQSAQLMGDHNLDLSALGHQQARQLGHELTRHYFLPADHHTPPPLLYISPYKRTRQTMSAMLEGAGVRADEVDIREDVRLREVEFGYDTDRAGDIPIPQQEELRRTHGWFFYRFRGGESPADCYDRMSSFLASLHRQLLRTPSQSVLVLSHGLALRCLLMRWLRLTVEQFDALDNPAHCQRIELVRGSGQGDKVGRWLAAGGGSSGARDERLWSVHGVRVRNENEDWKKEEMREAAGADSNEKDSKNMQKPR